MTEVKSVWAGLQQAEQIALERCRQSGHVEGWAWHARSRQPPLPFHDAIPEKGRCRVCGQPIGGGRVTWHPDCLMAYYLWRTPGDYCDRLLARQDGLCALTGDPIRPSIAEVDHRIPIYRVRRDHAEEPWFELLRFWSMENLQVISRAAHLAKCAAEALERQRNRKSPPQQAGLFEGAT